MDNNNILRLDLLDIIFDGRNKRYGAYLLRKQYNRRLWLALALVSLLVALLALLMLTAKTPETRARFSPRGSGYVLKEYFVKLPPPLSQSGATRRAPTRNSGPPTRILPDNEVRNELTDPENAGNETGPVTGTETSGSGSFESNLDQPGNNSTSTETQPHNDFRPQEQQPEFPGGEEALMRFLRNNLVTPDGLEVGEKKTVQVRFRVGADGLVSEIEVIRSAGSAFDREVIRVCRKMPRWQPAMQNGVPVSVGYMLPVTFVGLE